MSERLRILEPAAPANLPLARRVEAPIAKPPAPRVGERIDFEIPAWIWRTMVGCFAAFLVLLLAATGGPRAAFAIVISAIYVAMFFGTARAMLRQAPLQPESPITQPGGRLVTIYGPLSGREVAAQLLVVPAAIVTFGIAVLVIRLAVF